MNTQVHGTVTADGDLIVDGEFARNVQSSTRTEPDLDMVVRHVQTTSYNRQE